MAAARSRGVSFLRAVFSVALTPQQTASGVSGDDRRNHPRDAAGRYFLVYRPGFSPRAVLPPLDGHRGTGGTRRHLVCRLSPGVAASSRSADAVFRTTRRGGPWLSPFSATIP